MQPNADLRPKPRKPEMENYAFTLGILLLVISIPWLGCFFKVHHDDLEVFWLIITLAVYLPFTFIVAASGLVCGILGYCSYRRGKGNNPNVAVLGMVLNFLLLSLGILILVAIFHM